MSTEAVMTDTHNTASLRLFSLGQRLLTILMLLLLAVQFLLGMVVNLFVQVPSIHPGVGASNYFQGVLQGVAWGVVESPPGALGAVRNPTPPNNQSTHQTSLHTLQPRTRFLF